MLVSRGMLFFFLFFFSVILGVWVLGGAVGGERRGELRMGVSGRVDGCFITFLCFVWDVVKLQLLLWYLKI